MGNPQFIQFVSSHNKSYRTHRELTQRAQVFANNVEQIRQLNQVSEASGKSNAARYDVNEFTDMSSAEFGEMLGWKAENRLNRNGYDNYWKIQNSWGTGWGDQGFILFEIAEGAGVCGMNSYI